MSGSESEFGNNTLDESFKENINPLSPNSYQTIICATFYDPRNCAEVTLGDGDTNQSHDRLQRIRRLQLGFFAFMIVAFALFVVLYCTL